MATGALHGLLLGSLIVANYSFNVYPRIVIYTSTLLSIPGIVIFVVFTKENLGRMNLKLSSVQKVQNCYVKKVNKLV